MRVRNAGSFALVHWGRFARSVTVRDFVVATRNEKIGRFERLPCGCCECSKTTITLYILEDPVPARLGGRAIRQFVEHLAPGYWTHQEGNR